MKISPHERGEKQLAEYLDYFHVDKAYMVSFCFNKKKNSGLRSPLQLGNKTLIEAIV